MELTSRLLVEPKITFPTLRNEDYFDFVYLGYGTNKFLIQAWNRNQFVGVCQIKNGIANLPFDKEYRFENEPKSALCVLEDIKLRYKGLGRTLLSFSMEICKLNGNCEFGVVANKKSHKFYSKLGFEVNYTEDNDGNINPNFPDRWYLSYDLKKELPKREIIRLH